MRNQITEYNINNLIPNLNNVSNFFNNVPVILADNLEIDKNIEVKIKEKFIKSGSDKSIIHNYEKIYAYILNNVPENLNLLEIGMGTNNKNIISNMGVEGTPGASLRAFSSIFPNGKIYGADIDKEIFLSFFTNFLEIDVLPAPDGEDKTIQKFLLLISKYQTCVSSSKTKRVRNQIGDFIIN